jgi:hypothetical protein
MECGNSWLWTSPSFNSNNIGWWYNEISCGGGSSGSACKNNERGADAVYTANDCFNDGLDNMEPGKCYSLNPDRGTQYGWINNNAQDSWWWMEVQCGWNFFQKRYISENNSENFSTEENNSDYIWHGKARLFYDAAGRKTTAHPETRRFLFLPKKIFDEEQKSK